MPFIPAAASCGVLRLKIKDAGNRHRGWVEKQNFVSKDFDIAGHLDKIKGIWVPVWLFEVSAESAWHGEVSHTESYTEWETELGPGLYDSKKVPVTKEQTVWTPTSGSHFGDYIIPVSASRVLTQKEIDSLEFRKLDLKSYDESYLNGWQVQTTDTDKMEANELCNELIKNRE